MLEEDSFIDPSARSRGHLRADNVLGGRFPCCQKLSLMLILASLPTDLQEKPVQISLLVFLFFLLYVMKDIL